MAERGIVDVCMEGCCPTQKAIEHNGMALSQLFCEQVVFASTCRSLYSKCVQLTISYSKA